jgi:ABC-2 type transport system permease protein
VFYLRLIRSFARASAQSEMAYRANFWISLLNSLLGLVTGVLAVVVLFGQVESINGWDMASTFAILGVYLTVSALRNLFIGPSLEALAGMDGEVWTGKLDFTLLRPIDVQFQASFRHWRPLALIDLALGLGVIGLAAWRLDSALSLLSLLNFFLAIGIGILILYAMLLTFAGLVFWSPGFLFTWVFDGIFQMARYPVGVYPDWIKLILTWIVPVGMITTIPAEALAGSLSIAMLVASGGVALLMVFFATVVFRTGLRRYASASS